MPKLFHFDKQERKKSPTKFRTSKQKEEKKKCKQPEGELLFTAVRKSTLFYFNEAFRTF